MCVLKLTAFKSMRTKHIKTQRNRNETNSSICMRGSWRWLIVKCGASPYTYYFSDKVSNTVLVKAYCFCGIDLFEATPFVFTELSFVVLVEVFNEISYLLHCIFPTRFGFPTIIMGT